MVSSFGARPLSGRKKADRSGLRIYLNSATYRVVASCFLLTDEMGPN